MIDLNDYEGRSDFDLPDIRERLASTAYQWVPELYPQGVISRDRKTLRCADLSGSPPRNEGSCVIQLAGAYAGTGYDFATGERAGPIDLIAYVTGLSGRRLFEEAARIACVDGPKPPPRPPVQKKDRTYEVAFILEHCRPLAGSVAARYLAGRGLDGPFCDDLKSHPDLTDYDTRCGYPAMVAIVRDAAGNPTGGIHRTYLSDDGSRKAEPGKKMLGPVNGGAVRLAPVPSNGHLAIAEGIETALSAMQIFGLPCWAALSREHMIAWQWPAGLRKVTIFADAGKPGEEAAAKLGARLAADGIAYDVKIPMHGDDFNADLQRGVRSAEDYPTETSSKKPSETSLKTATELEKAAGMLSRSSDSETLAKMFGAIVLAELQPLDESRVLARIKTATGEKLDTLRAQLRLVRRRMMTTGDPTRDAPKPPWFGQLMLDFLGNPERNEANVMVAFNNDPAFAGHIVFDDFRQQVQVTKPLPWDLNAETSPRPWLDNDDIRAAEWLQRRNVNISPNVVGRSIGSVAREIIVHPVRDYLQSLIWDGVPRLETFALEYLGAEDTPLHRRFGALWIISAVARVMKPGCKVDHMLILEGPQGLQKSTALKALAGEEWFTDELAEIGSKDAAQQMSGIWIIEIAELDAIGRAEVSRIKAFLTRTTDRYRPPYGRNVIKVPRQCVFAGTVNPDTYLRDETGNRRFWPIRCGEIRLEAIRRDREQIWAEAVARYEAGAIWWLDDPKLIDMAKDAQAARFQGDAWDSEIDDWLVNDGLTRRFEPIRDVSIGEIMQGALRLEPGKWSRSDQMRVSAYLKRNGWERYNARNGNARNWRYRRGS